MNLKKAFNRKSTIIFSIVIQSISIILALFDKTNMATICLGLGFSLSALQIVISKDVKELFQGIAFTLAPLPTYFFLITVPLLAFETFFTKSSVSKLSQHTLTMFSTLGVLVACLLLISYPLFLGTTILRIALIKKGKKSL